MQSLKDFLTVSRWKIQLVSLASALLGPSIAAKSIYDLGNMDVLLFIALFYVTVTFSCNINCYYDRDVDRLYKKELYFATERLGTGLRYMMALEIILALVLAGILLLHGKWLASSLALLGLFLAYSYSAPPFRIKGKGKYSPLPVMIGVYVLPIIAGYSVLSMDFSPYFWGFLTGYFFLNLGINLVNVAEDVDVDARAGIRTVGVEKGAKDILKWAWVSQLVGISTPFFLIPMLNMNIWTMLFLALSVITAAYTFMEIFALYRSKDPLKSAKIGGKKLPKWFIITRYPLLLMAILSLI